MRQWPSILYATADPVSGRTHDYLWVPLFPPWTKENLHAFITVYKFVLHIYHNTPLTHQNSIDARILNAATNGESTRRSSSEDIPQLRHSPLKLVDKQLKAQNTRNNSKQYSSVNLTQPPRACSCSFSSSVWPPGPCLWTFWPWPVAPMLRQN